MRNTIDKFDGEYRFLSNFYHSPIVLDGITFPTVEHAFQAMKTNSHYERQMIAECSTPGAAKSFGRKVKLRSDWEQVKENIMEICLCRKFDNPELRQMLLDTGDAILIEGNTWGDTYWGICNNIGQNKLGQLLMKVREMYRRATRYESNT